MVEQYGADIPEMSLLYFQMNMRDNVVQCPHKEMEDIIVRYFKNVNDWTYNLRGDNPDWNKLFGNKISRKSEIDYWLTKTTHMQMNAALMIGKKYNSLNLAFIFALLIEKVPDNEQTQAFTKLSNYVRKHSSYSINKNDFEVFASYYGIHFKSEGSAINDETIDVDVKAVFNY